MKRLRLLQRRLSRAARLVQRRIPLVDQRVHIRVLRRKGALGARDLDLQLSADASDHVIQNHQSISAGAIVAGRPDTRSAPGVDQLDACAQARALRLDAALEHVAYAELGPDSRRVDLLTAIAHRGPARDDAKSADTRQRIGQIVGHQIGRQSRLLARFADARERQDQDRREPAWLRHSRSSASLVRGGRRLPRIVCGCECKAQPFSKPRQLAVVRPPEIPLDQFVAGEMRKRLA